MNLPQKIPPSGENGGPEAAAARLFDACQKPLQLPGAARPITLLAAKARANPTDSLDPPPDMPPEHAQAALSAAFLGDAARADAETRNRFAQLNEEGRRLAFAAAALSRPAEALTECAVPFVDDTRPRLQIYIAGPDAQKAAEAANRAAAVWNLSLPREARFAPDDSSKQFYLRRGDAMQAAAYKILALLRQEWGQLERVLSQDSGARSVHQFRVCSRRLRSVLQTFRSVLGKETLKPLEKAARAVARSSNQTRELDSLQQLIQDANCPRLLQFASDDRKEAYQKTRQTLDDGAIEHFKAEYAALLDALHPMNRRIERAEAQSKARVEARRLVQRHLQALIQLGDNIDSADMDRLHVMRIASKRLRYTVEALSGQLPKKARRLTEPLIEFQDLLGDDRDAALQEEYMERFLNDSPSLSFEEKRALELLCAGLRRRQTKARSEFLKRWRSFAARNKETP